MAAEARSPLSDAALLHLLSIDASRRSEPGAGELISHRFSAVFAKRSAPKSCRFRENKISDPETSRVKQRLTIIGHFLWEKRGARRDAAH